MLPRTSSWSARPSADHVKKLEQDYLTNGGASPRDAQQIRKLLQANGIAVGLTDNELAQAALHYYQQDHPSPLPSPRSSTGSPRSGGISPRNGEASATTSPRSGKFPILESRRRMSLAEFSGLANSMRRQSMIIAQRTDEEELVDQLRPRLSAARRSGGGALDSASQTTTASRGSNSSTSENGDDDDGTYGDELGIAETTVFDPLTASAKSADAELRGKTVSLKSLQKRLLSVGVPQGMAVLTGRPTENEHFHGSQKLPISRLNELVGSVPTLSTPAVVVGGLPPAPTRTRSERRTRPSVGNALRGSSASTTVSAITDTATLFRRLGGDPTDNGSVVSVARASLLVAAGALGGSVGETRAFLTALSQTEFHKLTFDTFIDVVNDVDLLLDIQPQTESPFAEVSKSTGDGASEDEGDDATADELNGTLTGTPAFIAAAAGSGNQATPTAPSFAAAPFSGSLPLSAGQRGTSVVFQHNVLIHDAAAAFLSNLVQGGRRRSQFAHADRMRQKIAKTLNDHMARTKRDCTFVRGLSYVLRLDPMLLHAFILRFRPRIKSENFSGIALAHRVLRMVEKVSALLKTHETCQVCYLQVDARKPQAASSLPKCANAAVVGCFTKLPRVPLEERPVVTAESISNLSSAAVSRKLKRAVGETVISSEEHQQHHPAPPQQPQTPPLGSSTPLSCSVMPEKPPRESTSHRISLRGCGFTAKTLVTHGLIRSPGAKPSTFEPHHGEGTRKGKTDQRHESVQPRYLSHYASDEVKLQHIYDNLCRERSRRREADDADCDSTHGSSGTQAARSPRVPPGRQLRSSYTGRHGFHF